VIEIGNDRVVVSVVPDAGGRIGQIVTDGVALLVGPGEGIPDPDDPLAWGSYPMVPWCGRIRLGRFDFDGDAYQLPINFGAHSIHGLGCREAWDVVGVADDHVRLELALPDDERWPFGGIARQRIIVDGAVGAAGTVVRMELSVTAGDRAMPAAIGWHPWFRKPRSFDFRPRAMYRRDEEWITVDELVPVPDAAFDDCFVNDEPVRLTIADRDREKAVTLASSCDRWVVFDMRDHGTCVEPQTAPPDAFNIAPNRVEPGDTLSAWFELTITQTSL
jgi:aldose 1-epimerase